MKCIFSFSLVIVFTSVICLNTNAQNVGIGTDNPVALLHVADSSVLFSAEGDVPGVTGNTPVSGAGRRMMWYAGKAAFRVGALENTAAYMSNWDKDSTGIYSIAMGYSTMAKGNASVAAGFYTKATGADGAIALGNNTNASGGSGAIALGYSTTASGFFGATALGANTIASGSSGATALGYGSSATGSYGATALGNGTKALRWYGATALGNYTIANGFYGSTAMGNYTIAKSYAEIVVGCYNTDYTPASTSAWNAGDRIFSIGNGKDETSLSDAVVVLKNGNTGIGTSNPQQKLEVNGNIRLPKNSLQNVTIDAGLTSTFSWKHNLGYQPVIMLSMDQTGGSNGEYVTMSYAHNSNDELTIYLHNNSSSLSATGNVYWIVVY